VWFECDIDQYIFPIHFIVRLMGENQVNLVTRVRPMYQIAFAYDVIGYIANYKVEDDKLWLEVPVLKIKHTESIKLKPCLMGWDISQPSMHLVSFYL